MYYNKTMNCNDDIYIYLFLEKYKNYFAKKDKVTIVEILEKHKNNKYINILSFMQLKYPIYMFFISLFFGWIGLDRLLLGQKKKALIKICLTTMIAIIVNICIDFIYAADNNYLTLNLLFLLIFLTVFMFLHLFIDIYNVYNDTYKYNFNLFSNYILESQIENNNSNKKII